MVDEITSDETMTLRMALVGYQLEIEKIENAISDLRSRLGQSARTSASSAAQPSAPQASASQGSGRPKRTMSAAARRRIAAAQRKRWAEHRRRLEAGS